jgi:uncharacterized protein (DUF952 family)
MKPYTSQEITDLADSAIDIACAFIQEQLNIQNGDIASLFFTGKSKDIILEVLQDYISKEIQFNEFPTK